MTSNVGAEQITGDLTLGFAFKEDADKAEQREYGKMRDKVMSQLKQTFRPEFLNRIDAVIVFHSLTKEQIREIVDLELARVRKQLAEQDITLEITDGAMGPSWGTWLRSYLRCASAAPEYPEPHRGPAR